MNLNYKNLHSPITKSETNAIYYLLRTLGRLKETVTLQKNVVVNGEYGDYLLGENTITVSNVEPIATYDVTYTIYNYIDETSRTVEISVDTEEETEITIPLPTLSQNEELNNKITVIITYQHIIQDTQYNAEITLQKTHILSGETNTITAIVTDSIGEPVYGLKVDFNIKGNTISKITDENGEANVTYTGTGFGWVNVAVMGEFLQFYDGNIVTAEYTGSEITLGYGNSNWLYNGKNVIIDWGDGTTNTVNNPTSPLSHTYNDGLSNHTIKFIGNVTGIGAYCFNNCTGLTNITLTSNIQTLGTYCFNGCTGLTSMIIPSTVSSIGNYCFYGCTNLIDYQLYWETNNSIIPYNSNKMPENPNTIFTVPQGTRVYYANSRNQYSSYVIDERNGKNIIVTSSTPVIEKYDTATINVTYINGSTPITNENLSYTVRQGGTIIDSGSITTDSAGKANFNVSGSVTGEIDIIVETQSFIPSDKIGKRFILIVNEGSHNYDLSLTADKSIIQKTESAVVTATLKDNNVAVTGETLSYQIKHGSTVISSGMKTTNSSGQATISYTGTGIGDVQVIVSYGSLLQETYEVIDSIFKDMGTISDKNDNWIIDSNGELNRFADYTQIKEKATTNTLVYVKENNTYRQFPNDIMIEMDIKQVNGSNTNNILNIRANGTGLTSSGLTMSRFGYNDNNWHTIQIKLQSNLVSAMVNGVVINTRTPSVTSNYWLFGFWTAEDNSEIHYKNLRIYPI